MTHTTGVPSKMHPRLSRMANSLVREWNRVGSQIRFYVTTLGLMPHAIIHHREEILRQIAKMGLGTGALAAMGGTFVISGFMTMTTGSLVAVQGYHQLESVGVEALTGFTSAYFHIRLITPAIVFVALLATIGAAATAQIGAMRINEEIDALEVMGINSISYMASTRVLSALVVVVPIFCGSTLTALGAARLGTTAINGQGSGVYDHYFHTFLNPKDVIWSLMQTVVVGAVLLLVHTYYGYTASGGPAGVGEAVGRSTRASLIITSLVIFGFTLAVYGRSADFQLAG